MTLSWPGTTSGPKLRCGTDSVPASAAAITGPADRYPFEPGSLTSAAYAAALFDRYPAYADTLRWLDEVVTQPDERLGRRGALCPRVRPALRADILWLVTVRTSTASIAEAVAKGRHLASLFTDLAGVSGRAGDASLLALFPDVAAEHAERFIDGGHAILRMEFVEAGLMLGEFHQRSTVGSVRNPALPAMRAPWPMFVVRALTFHDLTFLNQARIPPAERLQYLVHYRGYLADRLGPDQQRQLTAALRAAEAAVL